MSRDWTLGDVFVLRHAGFPFDWLEELGCSEPFLAQLGELLEGERALTEEARALGGEKAAERCAADLQRGKEPAPPRGATAGWSERAAAWKRERAAAEGA